MTKSSSRNASFSIGIGPGSCCFISIVNGPANALTLDRGELRESHPHAISVSRSTGEQRGTVVGTLETYVVEEGDTLLDVGRHFDLGYNEMTSANPGVDPWMPSPSEVLIIPTEFVLPEARPQGVVVNIPEMRLYHFQGGTLVTYPVGLGRDDWRTPEGTFKIRGKTENPTWVIPESIRAEHIRERDDPRTFIAGGDPENPLGRFRLELTLPLVRTAWVEHALGCRNAGEPRLHSPLQRGHRRPVSRGSGRKPGRVSLSARQSRNARRRDLH